VLNNFDNVTEVFRQALAVWDILNKYHLEGWEVLVRQGDKERRIEMEP
jgi:hypothetical protein